MQPPEPLALWQTPPFEPSVRDGKVFARGATDNKGNIVSRLAAVRALMARGGVPVTLKFMIEGQEEISSPGLPDFLERNRDMLQADGCIWEDTMGRVDAPIVSLGNKGMCKVELRCRVAATDSHSAYAGIYPNAAWRLIWALATIKGPDDRVLVPGFYDTVRPLDSAEQTVVERLPPMDGARLRRTRGVAQLVGGIADDAIHARQTLEPTCNIAGLVSGWLYRRGQQDGDPGGGRRPHRYAPGARPGPGRDRGAAAGASASAGVRRYRGGQSQAAPTEPQPGGQRAEPRDRGRLARSVRQGGDLRAAPGRQARRNG